MNRLNVAVDAGTPRASASPTELLEPDVDEARRLLMDRFPDVAAAIRGSGRLASGLSALQTATGMSPAEMADVVGARELASANRPVDVLVSRCMQAITQHSGEPDVAGKEVVGPVAPRPPEPVAADAPTWWQRTMRRGVSMTPPTVAGPVAERVALPIVGNRFLAVIGAVGGAGASTVATMLGQVLATCRSDRVVLTDAASLPGGVCARAGLDAAGALRQMLADEARIHGCTEVSRFVGRTPSRLDVAGLGPGDDPLSADEYRRASVILSRYYDLLVTDSGSVSSAEATTPVLGVADLVVVVAPPTTHGARNLDRTLDMLLQRGVAASRVLVTMNSVHRRSPLDTSHIAAAVGSRCSSFTTIPWDPHLAAGEAIDLRGLHPTTLQAVTAAAAALVAGLQAPTPVLSPTLPPT